MNLSNTQARCLAELTRTEGRAITRSHTAKTFTVRNQYGCNSGNTYTARTIARLLTFGRIVEVAPALHGAEVERYEVAR